MAKPVFGWSNERDGVMVVMDDGSVWQRLYSGARGMYEWREWEPLPNTERTVGRAQRTVSGPF